VGLVRKKGEGEIERGPDVFHSWPWKKNGGRLKVGINAEKREAQVETRRQSFPIRQKHQEKKIQGQESLQKLGGDKKKNSIDHFQERCKTSERKKRKKVRFLKEMKERGKREF